MMSYSSSKTEDKLIPPNDDTLSSEKPESSASNQLASNDHGSIVAAHYNGIEQKGVQERFNSPIFYLRNFNNWVKSVLIGEYAEKLRDKDYGRKIRILDICCGKGGDLGKWQKTRAEHVIFADIASVSIENCKSRYDDLSSRCHGRIFSAEFITADCTKETLRNKYRDPSINFDMVSCQFGFHYCFESLPQARRMLSNISECIKPGGYFIGTIPNAYKIVSRAQKSPNYAFGNRIYNIKLLFDPKEGYPLFGGKYDFHLEGVVDCPEFLVYFDVLVKLASEFGLELVYKGGFDDFYKEHHLKHRNLIQRINCFETYPPASHKNLLGDESEYEHAKQFLENKNDKRDNDKVNTMSTCEWEVATIYMAFAFKKLKGTLDLNGKTVYPSKNTE